MFSLGTIVSPLRNWKQCFCKIWRDIQRVLWYFWKWPIQDGPNLITLPKTHYFWRKTRKMFHCFTMTRVANRNYTSTPKWHANNQKNVLIVGAVVCEERIVYQHFGMLKGQLRPKAMSYLVSCSQLWMRYHRLQCRLGSQFHELLQWLSRKQINALINTIRLSQTSFLELTQSRMALTPKYKL